MYLAGIIRPDGIINGDQVRKSPRIRAEDRTFSYLLNDGETEIRIHQCDVRAIQLAKPGTAKSLSRRKRRLRKATTD